MNPNKPFGLGDKVGYALGDFGNDFTFMLSTMFLMKFYTDVMGVSAAPRPSSFSSRRERTASV